VEISSFVKSIETTKNTIMKSTPLILLLVAINTSAQQSTYPAQVTNKLSGTVTIMYMGQSIQVAPNKTVLWENAPKGEFIAYIYQSVDETSDTSQYIKRLGLVKLNNDDGIICFNEIIKPIPVYVKNIGFNEISLDYGDKVVFIPAGATRCLPEAVINPDRTITFVVSSMSRAGLSPPKAKQIRLEYRDNKEFYGEIS